MLKQRRPGCGRSQIHTPQSPSSFHIRMPWRKMTVRTDFGLSVAQLFEKCVSPGPRHAVGKTSLQSCTRGLQTAPGWDVPYSKTVGKFLRTLGEKKKKKWKKGEKPLCLDHLLSSFPSLLPSGITTLKEFQMAKLSEIKPVLNQAFYSDPLPSSCRTGVNSGFVAGRRSCIHAKHCTHYFIPPQPCTYFSKWVAALGLKGYRLIPWIPQLWIGLYEGGTSLGSADRWFFLPTRCRAEHRDQPRHRAEARLPPDPERQRHERSCPGWGGGEHPRDFPRTLQKSVTAACSLVR